MMKHGLLLVAFAGCPGPGTPPRPFGLERASVTLLPGHTSHVGFRVRRLADEKTLAVPPSQLEGKLDVAVRSFVTEDDAFAGIVTVEATLETRPGDYAVSIGAQPEVLRVTVSPQYSGAVEPSTDVIIDAARSRRSTIAKEAPNYTAVLAADGTVWETSGTDGGVRRVARLSGVRAITSSGPQGFRAITLEDTALDVRARFTLQSDGTIQGSSQTNVAAVRPFEFTSPPPLSQRMDGSVFLLTNGTVAHPSADTAVIRGAVDVSAKGSFFRRRDDVLFERDTRGVYRPLLSSPGLTAFEGDEYEYFEGSAQTFARHWLARTSDGVVLTGRGGFEVALLTPPAGIEITDVMARDRWWFALDGQRRLFMAGVGEPLKPTSFPPVRSAAPTPDVGVFAAPIPVTPGRTQQVALRVARSGFDGALRLTPALPAGLSAPTLEVPAQATSATLPLTFAASARVVPNELEFSVRGDGVERTALLSAELPRRARQLTAMKDVVLLTDGTVWRVGAGTVSPLPSLTNIVAITDNLALDDVGAVYSFGANNVGQLGRPTPAGAGDHPPAVVPGLPPAAAVAHCTNGMNLSLVLDRTGRVWRFGALTNTSLGDLTPTVVDQVPPMVDIGGEGSPAGLDSDGAVWLLLKAKKFTSGPMSRLGLVLDGAPATVDQNYSIPGHGDLSRDVKVLWFNGWATLVDETVWSLNLAGGLTKLQQLEGAEPAAYATQEGLVVKADGSLWRRATMTAPLSRVMGLGPVALPR
jgi:hypothetical protein